MFEIIQYQNDISRYYSTSSSASMNDIRFTPAPTEFGIVVIVVNIILLFCLLFTVGILGLWQLWYVSRNVTTIESFENAKIEELKEKVFLFLSYLAEGEFNKRREGLVKQAITTIMVVLI